MPPPQSLHHLTATPLSGVPGICFSVRRQLPWKNLEELLGHKGEPWRAHLRAFIAAPKGKEGSQDDLQWRFYLALDDGQPVGNICTWECGGTGLLGHVYTRPSHRRRGIARALLGALLRDASARGLRFLQLNAEPLSHQFDFYASAGFRPIEGVPGAMAWGQFPPGFAGDKICTRPFRWGDWPKLNALALSSDGEASPPWRGLGLDGHASLEFPLLQAFFGRNATPPKIYVLEDSASGQLGGYASRLVPPGGRTEILDVFAVPGAPARAARLLHESIAS